MQCSQFENTFAGFMNYRVSLWIFWSNNWVTKTAEKSLILPNHAQINNFLEAPVIVHYKPLCRWRWILKIKQFLVLQSYPP